MPSKLIVQYQQTAKELQTRGIRNENMAPENTGTTIAIKESTSKETNEWDQAHEFRQSDPTVKFVEPEINASEPFFPKEAIAALQKGNNTRYDTYISAWKAPDIPEVWHISDAYTGLKAARDEIHALKDKKKIRIAHLDTGYDEEHESFPKELINFSLSRNFVEGEDPNNAEDQFNKGILLNDGHGTGTLSILAGAKMKVAGCTTFNDYVGLQEAIEIVPIRIAKSVVLLKSAAFVRAMHYILYELNKQEDTKVHVITMSMGGLASRAWADMVNEAYDQGVFMVTAAGNNFKKLPTKNMIYPARFNRVVAACGVTYDLSPYAKPPGEDSFAIMEGNHGPKALMGTALAAFTPNVPWAIYKQKDLFGIRGDGTSSATPQIAAAAALYYAKHYKNLEKLSEPYMIVEAIRYALFKSALQKITGPGLDCYEYFGNGILQAKNALKTEVPDESVLKKRKQKKDKVFFPFLRLILGLRKDISEAEIEMLETELMQLALVDQEIQDLIDDPEAHDLLTLPIETRRQLAIVIEKNPKASNNLKRKITQLLLRFD